MVDILDKVYETGGQVSQATKDAVNLVRDTSPAPMELSNLTQFVISGSYFVSVHAGSSFVRPLRACNFRLYSPKFSSRKSRFMTFIGPRTCLDSHGK